MAKDSVKVLVLETDEPHPETKESRGSFGQMFDKLFQKAGNEHDPPLNVDIDMHFVIDDPEEGHHGHVPKASEISSDIHAILITGSVYDAHGKDRWVLELKDLLQELWSTRPDMKFAGVCFGHQLLNLMLGGEVSPHPEETWELGHTKMELAPVGQKLFRTDDKEIALVHMHQDQVTTLPSPERSNGLIPEGTKVHNWASSEHTDYQGTYIRDRLFTTQAHLGFDEKMVLRQIELRKDAGSIDQKDVDEVEEAKEKAHWEHDGLVVASAILRFFHGDDHEIA